MSARSRLSAAARRLGYVMPLPEDDRTLKSRAEYEDELTGLLGGRAAEEIDLYRAVHRRHQRPGAGHQTGEGDGHPLWHERRHRPHAATAGDSNPFMGMDFGEQRTYSEDVARKIDQEVRGIVDSAYARARAILIDHKDKLCCWRKRCWKRKCWIAGIPQAVGQAGLEKGQAAQAGKTADSKNRRARRE